MLDATALAELQLKVLRGRRLRSWPWRFIKRHIMGTSPSLPYREHELRTALDWENSSIETNGLRQLVLDREFDKTDGILNQQFAKLSTLIQLLGFVIAGLAIANSANHLPIKYIGLAAIIAIWTQMPRFKAITNFRKRLDAGIRAGSIMTTWDLYWYTYQWLFRRENTVNAIEILVIVSHLVAIASLVSLINLI